MGSDEVREGLQAAGEPRQDALRMLGEVKSEVDGALAGLASAVGGSTNQFVLGARKNFAKTQQDIEAMANTIREIDGKFDEYMEWL